MKDNMTVFALSAPAGGAIAITRISGPDTGAVLSRVFEGKIEHRRASFGRLVDEKGGTVDTCTVIFYKAPNSYTGEDVAEIMTHGSYAVVRRLAELISASGLARPAEPGEFTKRAYLAGKLDLAQAEAVMDIIASGAERSRAAAVRQLEGRLSSVITALYERVKALSARMAAYMDDDTDELLSDNEESINEIIGIKADIDELVAGGMRSRVLREGARIAIIGSPNVGKSSLMNALLLRERAIVTPIPGTTRDTIEESASIEGIPVVFIDTAGIRETEDEVEKLGVERSRSELDRADLVLFTVDGSREPNAEDEAIRASLGGRSGEKTLAVITKSDLERVVSPDSDGLFTGLPAVCVSSKTGDGLSLLRKRIAKHIAPTEQEALVTNSRHIRALEGASARLAEAAELIKAGVPDAPFIELRGAMDELASILGRSDPTEELVDAVFRDFCVGK
jgi:tRNA modification GTPase